MEQSGVAKIVRDVVIIFNLPLRWLELHKLTFSFAGVIDYAYKFILLAFMYWITGTIGLSIYPVNEFATLVWFPTGVSLAYLLLSGLNKWPAITLGAFLVNYLNGASWMMATEIALGNTLEALFGYYLLTFNRDFDYSLEKVRDVLKLIVYAAIISTTVSATIGTISLTLNNISSISDFKTTWIAWWVGDMISILIITPLFLVWKRNSRNSLFFSRLEVVFLFLTTIVISSIVFLDTYAGKSIANLSLRYLVFPPLIWASLRFSQKETTILIFTVSMLAVFGTLQNQGPFIRGDITENLFLLQSFIGVLAFTALLMTAAISERKKLEQQKDDFISVASHDLKIPITSLKGYIELIHLHLKNKRDPKLLIYSKALLEQSDRLINLTNSLLDLSRLQEKGLPITKEYVIMDNLVKEVVGSIGLIKSHQLNIEGRTKAYVYIDKARISQVLTNLLNNAIKYSHEGSRIIIKVSKSGEEVVTSIQDFGNGIEETYIDKIFEKYFQTGNGKVLNHKGVGLGLYISSEIIKQHGGKIWVKSKVGKGSTFSFSLPIV